MSRETRKWHWARGAIITCIGPWRKEIGGRITGLGAVKDFVSERAGAGSILPHFTSSWEWEGTVMYSSKQGGKGKSPGI